MITKWFKVIPALLLTAGNNSPTGVARFPVKAYDGNTFYAADYFYNVFPTMVSQAITKSINSAGICIGTGGTPATADDYNLETTLTTGYNATITWNRGFDEGGNPYIKYRLVITNTGSSELTIREIGYRQNIKAGASLGATSLQDKVILFDRTVLDTPVVIAPSGVGVIEYTLKTVMPT